LFFGIGLHQRSHFIRAVPGILFSVYSIYTLRDLAGEAREIVLLVALPFKLWQQMMTDVFACDVLIPEVWLGSFGAAAIAMLALGAIDNLADVTTDPHHGSARTAQLSQIYSNLFHLYERISNVVEELLFWQTINVFQMEELSNFLLSKFGGMQEQRRNQKERLSMNRANINRCRKTIR